MRQLTTKEEELMNHFWSNGPMLIKELQTHYAEPRPHVNTLATLAKILEEKGFLAHKALTPRCFQYYAAVTREAYRRGTLGEVVKKFFGNSYKNAISALVKDEKITIDELQQLIDEVKND